MNYDSLTDLSNTLVKHAVIYADGFRLMKGGLRTVVSPSLPPTFSERYAFRYLFGVRALYLSKLHSGQLLKNVNRRLKKIKKINIYI